MDFIVTFEVKSKRMAKFKRATFLRIAFQHCCPVLHALLLPIIPEVISTKMEPCHYKATYAMLSCLIYLFNSIFECAIFVLAILAGSTGRYKHPGCSFRFELGVVRIGIDLERIHHTVVLESL